VVTNNADARLDFSENAVVFDTVFTSLGSATRRVKVYNTNPRAIVIKSVAVGGGQRSPYTVLINGRSPTAIQDLHILGGDSLTILVTVTINPRNQDLPFVVYDSLLFQVNGKVQNLKLLSWGQDAVFLRNTTLSCNQTWTAGKPYILYDSVKVAPGCRLTIEAGAKVFGFTNSHLVIKGSLDVKGTPQNPVLFAGFRQEAQFDNAPGQWGGILFQEGSVNNRIQGAKIKNATTGLMVSTQDTDTNIDVDISGSTIQNMTDYGVGSINSDVRIVNSLLTNCGKALFNGVGGGNYSLTHCTMSNYVTGFFREAPSVQLSNTYKTGDLDITNTLTWNLYNNVIWGRQIEEISLINVSTTAFVLNQGNNLLKMPNEAPFMGNGNIFNSEPKFVDALKNDYRPDNLSPLVNTGMSAGITTDINGKLRDAQPDIGAYER
jgi:hypothetical protein